MLLSSKSKSVAWQVSRHFIVGYKNPYVKPIIALPRVGDGRHEAALRLQVANRHDAKCRVVRATPSCQPRLKSGIARNGWMKILTRRAIAGQ